MMDALHFLRPDWLWLVPPAALVVLANLRRHDVRGRWARVVDADLLDALLAGARDASGKRPLMLFVAALALSILGLAGPAWVRIPSPFTEDQAALVIVLRLGTSMESNDVEPSRLERARHKIHDLLAVRAGARTGLVVYAGSAHLVMPLTRDANVIASFADELAPALMPEAGDDVGAALVLADRMLRDSAQPGSILLITDALDVAQASRIRESRGADAARPVVLGALSATMSGEEAARLGEATTALGAERILMTADDDDVKDVSRSLTTALSTAADPQATEAWREAGYWVMPLLALLAFASFRPGWVVTWES
jgi:Ca-activated chloride channel family protein